MKKPTVLIAGDFFLDHYYYGKANRISPEAPVPVLNITSEKDIPGGAANVVNNLCAVGCSAIPIGIVGKDTNGDALLCQLEQQGANVSFMKQSESYNTIVKARVVAGNNHQIVRLDFHEEKPFPYIEIGESEMEKAVKQSVIAILSDYNKGFTNPILTQKLITICKKNQVPIIIDPKGIDWDKYRGADFITPNFNEFSAILNKQINNTNMDIEDNIAYVSNKFAVPTILVTRSEKGMTLFHEGKVYHIKVKTREVFDVSGAGDTAIAVLAMMLANKSSVIDAVESANIAAGIVVGKIGTATTTKTELESELRRTRYDQITAKIMDWDTLFTSVTQWKSEGKSIAVTNGCFDIFHRGHASSIQSASQFCDKLIVAINTDETVRKLKGAERPINKENDRAYVLAALECVDAVVIFPQDTPEELLSHIQPDVLAKGGEYNIEQVPGRQYAKRVELVNYVDGYSTTAIVNKSKEVL